VSDVSAPVQLALQFQREAAATSPLYKQILAAVLDDVASGGPCAAVLAQVDPGLEPVSDAVTLRFLGGVHRIVLEGRAPDLAAHYPSAGGRFDPKDVSCDLAEAFLATVAANRDELVAALSRSVQTNEVGRSAVLLLGYLAISRATGLPLRVFEVGASAGLNLRWDRYRYEGGAGGSAWGDPASRLRFTNRYVDPLPDLGVEATVLERGGCDAQPIDPATEDGRLTLRSFVWPDQPERFAALDAALAIAEQVPAVVDQADAGQWVDARLADPHKGSATVIAHSVVWQYLPVSSRRRVLAALEAAGARATTGAPVAWLRMEPGEHAAQGADVRLTLWPHGEDRLLAQAGYHGQPITMVPELE
jgi:hypothetical protein